MRSLPPVRITTASERATALRLDAASRRRSWHAARRLGRPAGGSRRLAASRSAAPRPIARRSIARSPPCYPSLVRISVVVPRPAGRPRSERRGVGQRHDHLRRRLRRHQSSRRGPAAADRLHAVEHTRKCRPISSAPIRCRTSRCSSCSRDKPRDVSGRAIRRFDDAARGEPVLAMGSPLALSQSVTRGIVSNTEDDHAAGVRRRVGLLDGEDVGTIVQWIGHDAAIYPGNSGGPLVNLAGEIVGVNEISFGLGGAIPSDLAQVVVEALIKRRPRQAQLDGRRGAAADPATRRAGRARVVGRAASRRRAAAGVKPGRPARAASTAPPVDVKYAEQLPPVNQTAARSADRHSRRRSSCAGRHGDHADGDADRAPGGDRRCRSELGAWGLWPPNLTDREAREMARASTDGVARRQPAARRAGRSGQAAAAAATTSSSRSRASR